MRSMIEDDLAIDEDVLDAFAVLEWLLVSRTVSDPLFVENRDVAERALAEQPAIPQANLGRIERGHLSHGVFEAQQSALTRIDTEDARKRSEAAGMWITAAECTFGG